MRLPDLLSSRPGRLLAFLLLYVTEGIPIGFAATAVATQMRRQGLGVAEIGAFVGALYLPWGFKWAMGPFVDAFGSRRLGRRRGWILVMQLLMIATLLVAMRIELTRTVQVFGQPWLLFSLVLLVHNVFAATQDVAIDALAVSVLPEEERGTANGFMFGGAYLGQAIGGSGALFLAGAIGFPDTFLAVCAAIALVTVFVVLPLREPPAPPRLPTRGSALAAAAGEVATFARDALRAFTGSVSASVAVLFALLPSGAMALGLALQSNLAVELGFSDPQVAQLNLWSTVISAICCIAGGWVSDRFGRRGTLAWAMAATALPTLALAWRMQRHGWVLPVAAGSGRIAPEALVQMMWASVIVYNVFQGLYYGVRAALFMDVTTPAVAATQFTAYMALMNLVTSYSALWQGHALARWGYPLTLAADAALGLLCLACLPWLRSMRAVHTGPSPGAPVPESIP